MRSSQLSGQQQVAPRIIKEKKKSKKKSKKSKKRQKNVHFSNPIISEVQFVSVSPDSKEARMPYWIQVRLDHVRFQRRIYQLEPEISKCLQEGHRDRMRNYIKLRQEGAQDSLRPARFSHTSQRTESEMELCFLFSELAL